MPFTEIVVPFLKQDESTRSAFEGILQPLLVNAIRSAPGLKAQYLAPVITENGINVQSGVKYALGIEWEEEKNLHDFIAGPGYQAIGPKMKPLAAGPPQYQLFNTDASPVKAFESPLTEVLRIRIGKEGNDVDTVKKAWNVFIAAVDSSVSGAASLSGTSLNLEQELFLGLVGWQDADARENTLSETSVKTLKTKLESLDGVESFTVSMVAQ